MSLASGRTGSHDRWSRVLGNGLHGIVSRFGVSPTMLGNTAIAALTGAEEIGRVAVRAHRGCPDIAVVLSLQPDNATMDLHLPVAVVAPALYCLILVLRRGLGRREGVLLAVIYVAYLAAAMRAGLGIFRIERRFGVQLDSGMGN